MINNMELLSDYKQILNKFKQKLLTTHLRQIQTKTPIGKAPYV